MLNLDPYLQGLEQELQRILVAAETSKRVWVKGATGSGRTTLCDWLEERPEVVVVRLPSLADADATVHGLYQAATYIDDAVKADALQEEPLPLRERASRVAASLERAGRILVLNIPASWRFTDVAQDPSKAAREPRARELLDGLLSAPLLRCITITEPAFAPTWLGEVKWDVYSLSVPRFPVSALEEIGSGRYDDAINVLKKELDSSLRLTPLQLRVAVGLLALGVTKLKIVSDLNELARAGLTHLGPLEMLFSNILRGLTHADLRSALRRLARARVALPSDVAFKVSHLPEQFIPLVQHCIGLGSTKLRLNEFVRRTLLSQFGTEAPDADFHQSLATYHRSLDGAEDPIKSKPAEMVHWLEKVHHLGHSGPEGRGEWAKQMRLSREMFWDCAWSLSYEQRLYSEAANVYEECMKRFGQDSYSAHYLGFNIDRAGRQASDRLPEAEHWLRVAVALDEGNAWWNGRLVTFLIREARYIAARTEWFKAVERIDPENERVRRDSWLSSQVHYWVASEWLEQGQVELAREVFDAVPLDVLNNEPKLRDLVHRIEDAEESRILGESVYPASTPLKVRWRKPQVAPFHNRSKAKLVEWFPGRVVEGRADSGILLIVATRDTDIANRRVILRALSAEEWTGMEGWCPPEDARGFVEVAQYDDGTTLIFPVSSVEPVLRDERAEDRARRYI